MTILIEHLMLRRWSLLGDVYNTLGWHCLIQAETDGTLMPTAQVESKLQFWSRFVP